MNTSSLDVLRSVSWLPDVIISGMQTGADLGGLYAAEALGVPTGGFCPKGFKTEKGPRPDLAARFGLVESAFSDYSVRTRQNVVICDVVILVAHNFASAGTVATKRIALELGKPVFDVSYGFLPTLMDMYLVSDIRDWLQHHKPAVINIAGNRESVARGIEKWTQQLIRSIFLDSGH